MGGLAAPSPSTDLQPKAKIADSASPTSTATVGGLAAPSPSTDLPDSKDDAALQQTVEEHPHGKEPPETVVALDNMGCMYHGKGDHEKALEYFGKAFQGYESILGRYHPSSLKMLNNMGDVYYEKGDHEKALEYYERVTSGCVEVLGEDHPETVNMFNRMGDMYCDKGDPETALEYYEKVMAGMYYEKGDREKAVECYRRAWTCSISVFGKYHPRTRSITRSLARIGYVSVDGKDNPETPSMLARMGRMYYDKDDNEKALECYERALELQLSEVVHGKDQPETNPFQDISLTAMAISSMKRVWDWD